MTKMLPVKILPPLPPQDSGCSDADRAENFGFLQEEFSSKGCQALLIGVCTFGEDLGKLPAGPRDALKLSSELSNEEKYKDCKVFTCENSNSIGRPTRENVIKALGIWIQATKENSDHLGFLYLATHGFYIGDTYHLCMTDSEYRNGTYTNTISWPELRTWLYPLRDSPVVVVLDCCRQILLSSNSKPSPPQERDIVLEGKKWAVITASGPGEIAQEGSNRKEGAHSLFSNAFLKILSTWPYGKSFRLGDFYDELTSYIEREASNGYWPFAQKPCFYVRHLGAKQLELFHWKLQSKDDPSKAPKASKEAAEPSAPEEPIESIDPRGAVNSSAPEKTVKSTEVSPQKEEGNQRTFFSGKTSAMLIFGFFAVLFGAFVFPNSTSKKSKGNDHSLQLAKTTSLSPKKTSWTCQKCLKKNWYALRKRSCIETQMDLSVSSGETPSCSLPCNKPNFDSVSETCRSYCRNKAALKTQFLTIIKPLSDDFSFSFQDCKSLLNSTLHEWSKEHD